MPVSRWRLVPIRAGATQEPPAPRPPSTSARLKGWARRLLWFLAGPLRGRLGVRTLRLPGRVVVVAESVDSLRHRLRRLAVDAPMPAGGDQVTAVRRLSVHVLWWRAAWPGWSGRVPQRPGLLEARVRLPGRGFGTAMATLRVADPVPVAQLLAAVISALRPVHPLPDIGARAVAGPTVRSRVVADAEVVNPRGRRPESYRGDAARVRLVLAGWSGPAIYPWRRGVGAELSWPTVAALRTVGLVECPPPPGVDAWAEASLLVQFALTGAVVHAPELPEPVGALLAPALRDILAEPLPAPPDRALAMELRSVRQRRTALREHSLRFAGDRTPPPVSALLATRRPDLLEPILTAIAGQTYPDLEIVVCLHGVELPPAAAELLAGCGRPYQVVPVDAEVPFGTALGLATARAAGSLLTKFDDDDTYGPEHVWDLVLARHYSGATLVGKGAEFVYLEDAGITVRRRSGRAEWDDSVVAGGTMLIGKGDLERIGGWRPVPRSVDLGLADRLNRDGATIYRTHPLGYLYHRRAQGHTWDPGLEFFLGSAEQRWDGLLRLPEFGTA